MQTSYEPWLKAIADANPGHGIAVPKEELSAGFYRHRSNGSPVAIWTNNDALVAKVGNEPPKYVDERWEENFFSYCDAVLESDYREAVVNGVWRDHIRVGSNAPLQVEDLSIEIENLVEIAEGMIRKGPAKTEEEARAAANVKSRLKEIQDLLETGRAAETAPIYRDINAIEAKARPLRDKVEAIQHSYETKKFRISSVMRMLVEQVAQPFLLRKREQQVAGGEIQHLRGGGTKPAPTNVGGTGAKITLKTSWHAKVVDYDKAVLALKDNAKMKALVQQLADAAARSTARVPVDGVEFYKQEKAQ
jgi:hypothetical protein